MDITLQNLAYSGLFISLLSFVIGIAMNTAENDDTSLPVSKDRHSARLYFPFVIGMFSLAFIKLPFSLPALAGIFLAPRLFPAKTTDKGPGKKG